MYLLRKIVFLSVVCLTTVPVEPTSGVAPREQKAEKSRAAHRKFPPHVRKVMADRGFISKTVTTKELVALAKKNKRSAQVQACPVCPPFNPVVNPFTPIQNPNALPGAFYPDPNVQNLKVVPPFTVGTTFLAGNHAISPSPLAFHETDNAVAVGREQILFVIDQGLTTFNRQGQRDNKLDVGPTNFLNLDGDFSTFIADGDPRVYFDPFTQRFYYVIINVDLIGSNTHSGVSIAVSDSDIISDATTWKVVNIFNLDVIPDKQGCPGDQGVFYDYLTLGIDKKAMYLGFLLVLNGERISSSLFVIPKKSLLSDEPLKVTPFRDITGFDGGISAIQPATNFDKKAKFGYIVANNRKVDGKIDFYRVSNAGSDNPILSSAISVDVLTTATPIRVPFAGNLYGFFGELFDGFLPVVTTAVIRDKQLYATQNILVNQRGEGDYAGDRNAIRWYRFDLTGDPTGRGCGKETETTVPVLIEAGTLFDDAATDPIFYSFGSVMVNKNNTLAVCGTLSSTTLPTSAFFTGRKRTDPLGTLRVGAIVSDTVYAEGAGAYTASLNNSFGQNIGDSCSTSLDPRDETTMWTVQPLAFNNLENTVVAELIES